MRRKDFENLDVPYREKKDALDRRFNKALSADSPRAGELTELIFNDLDTANFGIPQFTGLPIHERILISDYLYQCASSVEVNLLEARLHYLEWLDYTEQQNNRLANVLFNDGKMPKSESPKDDLPNAFDRLHIGGFFRSIGSTLDCLGAVIVGILGLPISLRKADIVAVRNVLAGLKDDGTQTLKTQLDFSAHLEDVISASGPEGWLTWTTQYRHMYVHRGRRLILSHFAESDIVIYGPDHKPLPPRIHIEQHLSKSPDKSDVEAMIKSKTPILNENAEITLKGIFSSSRQLVDDISEKLVDIWQQRLTQRLLITQPIVQWKNKPKANAFNGYDPSAPSLDIGEIISHPILGKRFKAAAVFDKDRSLWNGTDWLKS
jgi:hypothetical protein